MKQPTPTENFKARHPEWDGADIDLLTALAEADIKAANDAAEACRARERAMSEMLAADPRSAVFLRNWSEGADPVVELVRQFGPEIRDAIDNPALQEQMAEANAAYLGRLADERGLEEEFRRNIAESLERVDRRSNGSGAIDDATLERAWEWLRRVTDDGIRGIVSDEALDMALLAINHDADVASADAAGRLAGRNEAIEAHMRGLEAAGDGTIASSATGGGLRNPRRRPPLGVIDSFDSYRSVWD